MLNICFNSKIILLKNIWKPPKYTKSQSRGSVYKNKKKNKNKFLQNKQTTLYLLEFEITQPDCKGEECDFI